MNIDKAAILIKKAALEFDKMSNPILAEYNLTASQFKVLKFLYSSEREQLVKLLQKLLLVEI